MKVNDEGGFKRKLVSPGMHIAVCYQIVDLGTSLDYYNNMSHKVQLGWEILDESYEIERDNVKQEYNFLVYKEYTASLGENTNLRKDLESWRSKDFTVQELKGFELKNILGVPCQLNIKIKTSAKGNEYPLILSVNPIGKNETQKGNKEMFYVGFDEDPYNIELYKMLPEFLQERIKNSDEWMRMMNENHEEQDEDSSEEPNEEEIPF